MWPSETGVDRYISAERYLSGDRCFSVEVVVGLTRDPRKPREGAMVTDLD